MKVGDSRSLRRTRSRFRFDFYSSFKKMETGFRGQMKVGDRCSLHRTCSPSRFDPQKSFKKEERGQMKVTPLTTLLLYLLRLNLVWRYVQYRRALLLSHLVLSHKRVR